MLALEFTFLRAAYFATGDQPSEPEYPPAPSRVFSACVEAFYGCELPPGCRGVLERLEQQPPPLIHTSRPFEMSERNNENALIYYVPTAQADEDKDAWDDKKIARKWMMNPKQPLQEPVARMREPRCIFLWPNLDLTDAEHDALDAMLAEVTHLGRRESLVVGKQVKGPDLAGLDLRFVPDERGSDPIKVPTAGALEALDRAFETGNHHNHWARAYYRKERVGGGRPSFWGELLRFRIRGRHSVHITRTLRMAEAIRARIESFEDANGTGLKIPSVFHGHDHDHAPSHIALIPLAYVHGKHADGLIKGFGLCLPRDIAPADRDQVLLAFGQLCETGFHINGDHFSVEAVGADNQMRSLQEDSWVARKKGGAKRWVSATPVALDLRPKKNCSVEKIIARSCRFAGLPAPRTIEFRRVGFLGKAVPESSRFHVTRKGTRPFGWGHLEITFDEPVRGPVTLGQLRHFGVGTMVPADQEDKDA